MASPTLQRLRIEWPKLAKAVAGLAGAGIKLDAPAALDKAADLFGAVSLRGDDAHALAERLLSIALAAAIARTLEETPQGRRLTEASIAGLASDDVAEAMQGFRLGTDTLASVAESDLVVALQGELTTLLQRQGATATEARRATNRFPGHVVEALQQEWRRDPATYKPIETGIPTPFDTEAARRGAWQAYLARLPELVREPLFGTQLTLEQVYEPLWGHTTPDEQLWNDWQRQPVRYADPLIRRIDGTEVWVLVELDAELRDWLAGRSRCRAALRVLAGGPGSGKSSVAKMLAAERGAMGLPTLFVPVHLLDLSRSTAVAIEAYARTQGLEGFSLERTGRPRDLLLILDGLDEIAMQGSLAREKAMQLVDDMARLTERGASAGENDLRVLIGGRELVVQDAARSLRDPGQVVHLVGYEAAEATINGKPDQRDAWWARFAQFTGQDWTGLPAPLRASRAHDAALADITDQPLLNFLLASTIANGALPADQASDLATLYDTLLHEVYERRWGARGARPGLLVEPSAGQRPDLLAFEDFDELLQAIALAAWHHGGRAVTETEGWRYAEASNLGSVVARLRAGNAQGGLHGFLVAFYAKRSTGTAGEPSFEFTHKSFAEYLAARRLVREVMHAVAQMARQAGGRHLGWTADEALKHLAAHFGPRPLDGDVIRFVRSELARQSRAGSRDGQEPASIHDGIVTLLNRCFRVGVAADPRFMSRAGRDVDGRSLRDVEASLFMLRSMSAEIANAVSEIEWPTRNFFCRWLNENDHPLIHRYLSNCSYFNQIFDGLKVNGAKWRNSHFIDAYFVNCQIMNSSFGGSRFQQVAIVATHLIRCTFDLCWFEDVIVGNYARTSERYGHETVGPPVWNLVGNLLFIDGPRLPQEVVAPAGWLPPTDCVFSRSTEGARFKNVIFVRCHIYAVDDFDDDDPDDLRYAKVTLVNCIVQGNSSLVALAKENQTPKLKGDHRFLQVYCLPDGTMPFGEVPPGELPLP
jgi:uncharacterized protein YjbI with pentapeptide repeats